MLDKVHALGLLSLDRLQLAIRGEDHLVIAKAVGLTHAAKQLLQRILARLRSLEREVRFGHFVAVGANDRIRNALVSVRDQDLRLLGIQAQFFGHANIVQVADHVRVQVRLFGDENRHLAIHERVLDHGRNYAALADACLVANDEAAPFLCVLDGERQGINLFGREVATE